MKGYFFVVFELLSFCGVLFIFYVCVFKIQHFEKFYKTPSHEKSFIRP